MIPRNIHTLLIYTLLFLVAGTAFGAAPPAATTIRSARAQKFWPPRLSPMPDNMRGARLSLNGTWWVTPAADSTFTGLENTKDWSTLQVPGEWVMQGMEVKPGDKAGYVRRIQIPPSWSGRRVKLRCNGVYSGAELIVNGNPAGTHMGGFTPFETDITEHITFGTTNTIAMRIQSETAADSVSSASVYASHTLGGIPRDISLVALPPVNIAMFHTSTSFTDSAYTEGRLRAEVTVANETTRWTDGLSLHFILRDSNGNEVELPNSTIDLGGVARDDQRTLETVFDIPGPKKWDPEHPRLYTLTCELARDGRILTSATRRVGFREIEVKGNQLLVNGVPVKLRGVNRHEVSPDRGRSPYPDAGRNDVELFRRANVNYIRTSHYPPDESLLDAADELGMFVEVEAPFCWAHQSNPDPAIKNDLYLRQHLETINAFRSHPSVIMWSLGNESVNYEDFRQAAEAIAELDPSRPRVFSQWGPDADKGELEIANHHYPGPSGPEEYRNYQRPVVFDEYCHINAYNRLELATDPGLRDVWGELLDRMWTNMYHSTGVTGGAVWSGIDDTFFLSDGRPVGYGTWGTVDGWRREKPEYWGMKKAYSPVKIWLHENGFDGRTLRLHVENRHLFTDLSECTFRWEVDKVCGEATRPLPPRSEGDIEIELPSEARNAREIELSVIGSRGFEVDRYRFRNNQYPALASGKKRREKPNLKKTLPSEPVAIKSGDRSFTIDNATGSITASTGNHLLLGGGPTLMILPLNGEGGGLKMTGDEQNHILPYNPVCDGWELASIKAEQNKDEVTVTVAGAYKQADGTYTYRFTPDGALTVDYDFAVHDTIAPRQTGLVFATSADINTVSWIRDGYWNTYPENHIGATEGTATASTDTIPLCGIAGPSERPTWAWDLDRTEAGSNVFRATKRNIRRARLTNADASAVITVESDGSQHLRPWVDGEFTRFLVADYTNGGHEGFLVPHAAKDYRALKPGDRVKGSVRLSFR